MEVIRKSRETEKSAQENTEKAKTLDNFTVCQIDIKIEIIFFLMIQSGSKLSIIRSYHHHHNHQQ